MAFAAIMALRMLLGRNLLCETTAPHRSVVDIALRNMSEQTMVEKKHTMALGPWPVGASVSSRRLPPESHRSFNIKIDISKIQTICTRLQTFRLRLQVQAFAPVSVAFDLAPALAEMTRDGKRSRYLENSRSSCDLGQKT